MNLPIPRDGVKVIQRDYPSKGALLALVRFEIEARMKWIRSNCVPLVGGSFIEISVYEGNECEGTIFRLDCDFGGSNPSLFHCNYRMLCPTSKLTHGLYFHKK